MSQMAAEEMSESNHVETVVAVVAVDEGVAVIVVVVAADDESLGRHNESCGAGGGGMAIVEKQDFKLFRRLSPWCTNSCTDRCCCCCCNIILGAAVLAPNSRADERTCVDHKRLILS